MGTDLVRPSPTNGEALTESFGQITRHQRAELAAISIAARVRAEVEASFLVAQRNPRNEDEIRAQMVLRCRDSEFAAAATYAKPIGGGVVRGLTIRFAEELLRVWGNINVEMAELYDDDEKQIIQVVSRDLQANTTMRQEFTLLKTVERSNAKHRQVLGQRVNTHGEVVFIVAATEDELQTKKAAQLSKAIRQLTLRILPAALKAECTRIIQETVAKNVKQDPESNRKQILDAFAALGVTPKELSIHLKQDVKTLSPAQLVKLRELYTALKEGMTTWAEVKSQAASVPPEAGTVEFPDDAELGTLTPGESATHTSPAQAIGKPRKKG